jgi:glucose/arabinose dehydrogenase
MRNYVLLVVIAAALAACWAACGRSRPPVEALTVTQVETPDVDPGIQVRAGYELTVAVPSVENARFMEMGPEGELYVSQPNLSQITHCRDADGDGVYEELTPFVQDRQSVHAMQWHDGWLWLAYAGTISRARDTDGDGTADEEEQIIGDGVLVPGGGHWWRSLLVLDGRIYTSIGDSGNITDERDTKRQKIYSYSIDGGDEQLFCSGIRNTEKLVVRPGTSEIWGMDHGSDWFGGVMERRGVEGRPEQQPITDLNPPDEMNHYVDGGFYGHPFVVGSKLPRYEYMDREDIVELADATIPPEWPTGAHWAPNAMEFYTGDQFPGAHGDAFVAYHGSWNRSVRSGYCVSRVYFEDGHPWGEQVYAKFVGDDGEVYGRPVDVVMEPDGSLLISEDWGNRVYRLRYVGGGEGSGLRSAATSAGARVETTDIALAPVDTYSRFCARCHGPEGEHLLAGEEGEFRHSTREELHEITKEMMLQTAALDASEQEIDAMTDYMVAIQGGEPFGSVSNAAAFLAGDTDVLQGDARPGSSVTIEAGGEETEATVDGNWWSVEVTAEPPFTITIEHDGDEATWEFPEELWP